MALCRVCKERLADPGSKHCRRHYRSQSPRTPLRQARERMDVSLPTIARKAGLALTTVEHVAQGRPATRRVALALERVTGVNAGILMRGVRA